MFSTIWNNMKIHNSSIYWHIFLQTQTLIVKFYALTFQDFWVFTISLFTFINLLNILWIFNILPNSSDSFVILNGFSQVWDSWTKIAKCKVTRKTWPQVKQCWQVIIRYSSILHDDDFDCYSSHRWKQLHMIQRAQLKVRTKAMTVSLLRVKTKLINSSLSHSPVELHIRHQVQMSHIHVRPWEL